MRPGEGTLDLVAPSAFVLMPLDEVKSYGNIADNSSHDGDIITALLAATEHVENVLGRAILTQTFDWLLPDFGYWNGLYRFDGTRYPGYTGCPAFRFPRAPLQSVTHVKYSDADDAEQTIDPANYRVIAPRGPMADAGTLDPVSSFSWPSISSRRDAVRIRFVAGYGGPEKCPAPIRQAVKQYVNDYFENRESQLVGVGITDNPATNSLLYHYIVRF